MSENLPEASGPKTLSFGTIIQWTLILMVVAVVVIFILALIGPATGNVFSNIGHGI
jgi:hypothetical protein